MNLVVHALYYALLAVFLSCCTPLAVAQQNVDIDFVSDAETGREVIKAQYMFRQHTGSLRKVLLAVNGYAELHDWITRATLVKSISHEATEFLIEFEFPWPVGRRWSIIEVHKLGSDTIVWHQITGDMKANEGRLHFTEYDRGMKADYSAIIAIGMPDAVTRGFKKKFVTEFISAAFEQAASATVADLKLATSSVYVTR